MCASVQPDSFLTTVVEIVRPYMEPDGSIGDGHLFRAIKEAQPFLRSADARDARQSRRAPPGID